MQKIAIKSEVKRLIMYAYTALDFRSTFESKSTPVIYTVRNLIKSFDKKDILKWSV